MSERTRIARTRIAWRGWVLVAAGLPAITLASCHARGTVSLATVLLLHVALATAAAAAGGVLPGSVALVAGFGLANWYRVAPQHQLAVGRTDDLVALVVYVVVGGGLALLTDRAARTLERARRAGEATVDGDDAGSHDARAVDGNASATVEAATGEVS